MHGGPMFNQLELLTTADIFCFLKQCVNKDVGELKTQCLESFRLFEECRQLNSRNTDPYYEAFLRQRPLDPLREQKMRSINTCYNYIDSEINNVDMRLDQEWETYQAQKYNKRSLLLLLFSDHCHIINIINTNATDCHAFVTLHMGAAMLCRQPFH